MSEELGNVRVRMFISSIIIKYSRKFEVLDMGSGVVRIKKPSIEPGTDDELANMGFGCYRG
jgi:hypothetical protein